jgi:hypothetical protein
MKQDHESVRTLAIQIGVREAARQLGLNENTVRQWSSRNQWFKQPTLPPTHNQNKAVTSVTSKPGDVLLETLAELKGQTKLSLARSAARMAKDCEELPVKHAKLAHTVAQTYGIVHEIGENKGQAQFTLNVLNMGSLQVNADQPEAQD